MTTCNPCISSNATDPLSCSKWDLTQQPKTNCLINNYQQESLNIAGAIINIRKLLGVTEQTKLIDLTSNGMPLSSGDAINCPTTNAFTSYNTYWKSLQAGSRVTQVAYIGYDFGTIRLPNGRERYSIDTSIRHMITSIKIKQGPNKINRVAKARVERSEDGINWYGVSIITLPDNGDLNSISFKQTVTNRYWRIRPIVFNGGDCDSWIVYALELSDMVATNINNIQDPIFMENRDRKYSPNNFTMKGFYDLQQNMTDLTRFGISIQDTSYQIKLNFNACVAIIGRPIVIGDIIELPSEIQYTPDMIPVKKFLEVTDVTWDAATFTPGWMPTTLAITAKSALASQETQDIFGKLSHSTDSTGLLDNDDGSSLLWQDYSTITQQIKQQSLNELPELGSDISGTVRQLSSEEVDTAIRAGFPHITRLVHSSNQMYAESALPPNGLPYTEATTFPTNPTNGDYHRMIYVGLSSDVPASLYRWSSTKARWIYLETDERAVGNDITPILSEYRYNQHKIDAKDIK